MGVDPTTGMYTPDVSYQPTGALGAVTSLLNSQKANQIADTLQQQRQAQADLESQQSQQYGLATQRQQNVRDAMAQVLQNNPNPGTSDFMNAALANGDDPAHWTPLMRSMTSAGGKLDTARVNALSGVARTMFPAGATPQQVGGFLQTLTSDPAEMSAALEQWGKSVGGNQPLPKPAAQAAALNATSDLKEIQAAILPQNAAARQDLDRAYATLARAKAAVAGRDALEPWEVKELYKNLRAADMVREKYATDKMGIVDPGVAAYVQKLDAEKATLLQQIQMKSAKAGPAGPGTAAPTLPAWMGGGAAPSASAAPSPTTKTLVFPP